MKNDSCFICRNLKHFSRNCPQLKKSKEFVHLFEEIDEHVEIYIRKDNKIKLIFLREE